ETNATHHRAVGERAPTSRADSVSLEGLREAGEASALGPVTHRQDSGHLLETRGASAPRRRTWRESRTDRVEGQGLRRGVRDHVQESPRGVDYDAVRRFLVSEIDQANVVTSTRLASLSRRAC